ncbi:hypothetical protein KY334_04540, partial [Candidatus Woesearchaeota archaeon]|nr:hypothetical protein [Candidatus Woesearchaeota archaeon]
MPDVKDFTITVSRIDVFLNNVCNNRILLVLRNVKIPELINWKKHFTVNKVVPIEINPREIKQYGLDVPLESYMHKDYVYFMVERSQK